MSTFEFNVKIEETRPSKTYLVDLPGSADFALLAAVLNVLGRERRTGDYSFALAGETITAEKKDAVIADKLAAKDTFSYEDGFGKVMSVLVADVFDGLDLDSPFLVEQGKGAAKEDPDGRDKDRIEQYFEALTAKDSAERIAQLNAEYAEDEAIKIEAQQELSESDVRIGWLYACLCNVPLLYGSMPLAKFEEMVNKEMRLSTQEILQVISGIPVENNPCVLDGDRLIGKNFYEDGSYMLLERQQGDKPYYIPSSEDVLELASVGYPESQPECMEVTRFMREEFGLDVKEAMHMTGTIWFTFSLSSDMEEVARVLQRNHLVFPTQDSAKRFASLMTRMQRKTRMLVHRGFCPDEITSMMPSGNQAKSKKVYPNAPCPCGSGKKYKHCHGRK